MKKQSLLAAFAMLMTLGCLYAQDGQRQTPEERTKTAMEKIAVFNLDAEPK